MDLPYAGQLGGTTQFIVAPATMSQRPSSAMLAGKPVQNTVRKAKFNKSIAAETKDHVGRGHGDDGPVPEPEPMPEPMPSRPRRGSMKLSEALAEGLISKADFDKYMDEYLKKTFGVSSDKELAEMKRQHRMARQGAQKGKGKRHRPLSRQMERRLAKHAETHSAEHIMKMKADIQSGMTFKRAHSRAMASVGK